MYNVLVVDDDRITLETLGERLKSYGDFFTPIYACNGKEAVEAFDEFNPKIIPAHRFQIL